MRRRNLDTASSHLSQSQIEFMADNLPSSLVAVAVGVVSICIIFYNQIDRTVLLGWTAAAVIVLLFRLGVYLWVKKRIHNPLFRSTAIKLITYAAAATGMLWGSGSILFSIPTDMFYWIFLAFFMSGYASGAVFSTSAYLPACASYFFPTILPITLWFFVQDDSRAPLMGVLLLTFTFAAWNMARNAHRLLVEKVETQIRASLRDQEAEARDAKVESLRTMAGGIAHDLNNALAGIVGNLYLIQRENGLSAKVMGRLHTMQQGLSDAGELGKKMLEYSRSSMFFSENIDIMKMLTEKVSKLKGSHPYISLISKIDAAPITGDPAQIERVLDSLISNAMESYSDHDDKKIDITVSECVGNIQAPVGGQVKQEPPLIRVNVTDHGCGIPPAIFDNIFDPFVSTKFTGRGLGMSVVYGVMERMNGRVEINSTEGSGTTVTLFFHKNTAPYKP